MDVIEHIEPGDTADEEVGERKEIDPEKITISKRSKQHKNRRLKIGRQVEYSCRKLMIVSYLILQIFCRFHQQVTMQF